MEQAAPNSYIQEDDMKVVLTIKYKLYIALMVIIVVITWGYMNNTVAHYDMTRQTLVSLQNQKTQKEAEYNQVVDDLTMIKNINTQKVSLLACLSTKGCTSIPDSLTGVVPQMRAFLQLQKNDGEKMAFDQKKILANINEYLVKGPDNQANGAITSIIFGNLATVSTITNLVQIPITLTIDFADKNGLLSFVYNVENTISPKFPMFYTINSINYDIVKYQQNQSVTIELVGYMIQ